MTPVDGAAARAAARRWIGAIAVAAMLAIAGAMSPELRWLHYLCKPLATLLVAAMVFASEGGTGRYRLAVLVGLLLSALGDVFLMLTPSPHGPDWFVFGLASFLSAHVAYLAGFCGRVRLFAVAWPFLGYALFGAAVLAVLWPHLPAALRVPVVAYVLVLTAMAAQSAAVWWRLRDRAGATAALGGGFFVVSDATLAIDRFVAPFPAAIIVVLASYWCAQVLIGWSARAAGNREA
jgi:uncharacterized membrane protein YhhN